MVCTEVADLHVSRERAEHRGQLDISIFFHFNKAGEEEKVRKLELKSGKGMKSDLFTLKYIKEKQQNVEVIELGKSGKGNSSSHRSAKTLRPTPGRS